MHKGYTLIEIIIVITVIAILTGLASLSIVSFGKSSDIDTSQTIVSSSLKEAQANSIAVLDDKAWGVYLESNRVIIYGSSDGGYIPGDPANQVKLLSSNTSITWSDGSEILFSKRTGKTLNPGTITVSGGVAETKIITINSEGMIE